MRPIADTAARRLWGKLDDSYFLRHDEQDIVWHTRLLNYRVETTVPIVKARLSPVGEGLQVTAGHSRSSGHFDFAIYLTAQILRQGVCQGQSSIVQ